MRVDVSQAHFGSITEATALDTVIARLKRHGSALDVVGMNLASQALDVRLDAGEQGATEERPRLFLSMTPALSNIKRR